MKTAVLLSGGLDSAVCLAIWQHADDLVAVTVDYGQPSQGEKRAAQRLCAHYNVQQVRVGVSNAFEPGVGLFGNDLSNAPSTVVPHRNLVLLSLAAAATGAQRIVIGCNADDLADYVDCRPAFLRQVEAALGGVMVVAPLIDQTKREVVKTAKALSVPIEDTVSCYLGTGCGECSACKLRIEALS